MHRNYYKNPLLPGISHVQASEIGNLAITMVVKSKVINLRSIK